MNILITGLTLHNNKGGPALALSLIDKLKENFLSAHFFLSVPNFLNNLEKEKEWAKVYGIDGVTGAIGAKELLGLSNRKKNVFITFLKDMDLVVDLYALSYMDLPHRTYKRNLIGNLNIYTIRYFCDKLNIPLIRWTQSYGPFSSIITKKIVRKDLKKQKYIFTRGTNSLKNMQELFNHNNMRSFPDIAITLKVKDDYYRRNLFNKKYITLSPSSVIFGMEREKHIQEFQKIADYIKQLGYIVVFVPHNLMSIKPSLSNCDLKVCEKIINEMSNENIILISDDLDVYNLKGIISGASMHVGARYHSIIASLSTGVPTIAFSWHEKYKDIMRMYGMEQYVYDGKSGVQQVLHLIDNIEKNQEKITLELQNKQRILEKDIEENLELFMENYHALQNM